jgi:asparagine synthase (glutamine-hydrolysing)
VLPGSLITELTGVSQECPGDLEPGWAVPPRDQLALMTAAEVVLYLQATLLSDADTFAMTSSVELRVPFVDSTVFSAALAAASSAAHGPGGGRPVGKKAIGRALGDPFLEGLARQAKRGFSLPMRQWMDGPLAPTLRAAEDTAAPVWSLLDRDAAVRAGLLPFRPRDRWSEVWAVAALNAWLQTI